ncbi:MAG: hypothetical protein Q8K86_02250 [Candidatus Nanopelagicaceae bacterium]|nr:hypothetical protein [Candidatus Nanopelagicaceae bacterium]
MKKFIALSLAALAVLTMTGAPANAAKPTVTTSAIPGGNWCC